MAISLMELLLPQVVLDVYSRLKDGRGPMGAWLGFYPNRFDQKTVSLSGPNTIQRPDSVSVRNVSYRLFDHTRVPMKGRAPGTGPATVAANPVGSNTVAVARFHQKLSLQYEFLGNLSPIVGPNAQVDPGGEDYVSRQWTFLHEQGNNALEMMAAGLLRDSLYFVAAGDNWLPTFTAPTGTTLGFQIDFKIPAGNKNQLNMLGTGNIINVPWNNPAAPIFSDIQAIKADYALLTRYPLTDVWVNSTMVSNVLTNTQIRNLAGSSNTPFAEFDTEQDRGWDASGPANHEYFILKALPNVKWHVNDDALVLGNTDVDPVYSTAPAAASLAKEVPDNMAIFTTEPNKKWVTLCLGGEYVVENPGQQGMLRMGWYNWPEYVTQPSVIELLTLLNAVPILPVPKCVAPATVIF